jgi:hypothetical protein
MTNPKPPPPQSISAADLRATIESEVLSVVSAHGGERIIAGPPMYQLVQELTDLVLNLRTAFPFAETDDKETGR